MDSKVSIIIPTYNCPYVDQAIKSALNQTYHAIEVIVVNDGSTKYQEKIRPYLNKIRYVEKENGGTASALNIGIKNATGDYFAWLSSDDYYLPEKISKQMAFMKVRNADVSYSNFNLINPDNKVIKAFAGMKFPSKMEFYKSLQHCCPINGSTVMIKMDIFNRLGLFDETLRYTQDFDMWLRVVQHHEFHYLNEPLTLYRIHEEMGTKKYSQKQMEEANFLFGKFHNELKKLIMKENEKLHRKEIFTNVYKNNLWRSKESVSGTGSSYEQTKAIIKEIPRLIELFQIKTMLDAPCGDFNWMKNVKLNIDQYIGADIVSELIKLNNQKYSNLKRGFLNLDIIVDPLPEVDLILCRDCFVHLSFDDVRKALNNLKRSGSKYLLTTTFTNPRHNIDSRTGYEWRPLNLQLAPFHFPKPIYIINENCTEEGMLYSDKSLALWKLNTLHF